MIASISHFSCYSLGGCALEYGGEDIMLQLWPCEGSNDASLDSAPPDMMPMLSHANLDRSITLTDAETETLTVAHTHTHIYIYIFFFSIHTYTHAHAHAHWNCSNALMTTHLRSCTWDFQKSLSDPVNIQPLHVNKRCKLRGHSSHAWTSSFKDNPMQSTTSSCPMTTGPYQGQPLLHWVRQRECHDQSHFGMTKATLAIEQYTKSLLVSVVEISFQDVKLQQLDISKLNRSRLHSKRSEGSSQLQQVLAMERKLASSNRTKLSIKVQIRSKSMKAPDLIIFQRTRHHSN